MGPQTCLTESAQFIFPKGVHNASIKLKILGNGQDSDGLNFQSISATTQSLH